MKKSALLFVIGAAALLFGACGGDKAGQEKETAQKTETGSSVPQGYAPDGTVHELDDASLYAPGARVPNLTVLDFNAVWCGPCRALAPVLEETAAKYNGRVTFVSVDVDTYGQLFDAWRVGQSIPAVVFIQPDGNSRYYVGTTQLLPAENLESIIDRLLD